MSIREQLRGTGVAVVTPFQNDLSVDYPALGILLDHLVNNKVDYIVTLGTTGETPVLSADEKKAIIDFTRSHLAGRIPFVIGIGGNDTKAVINDLKSYDTTDAVAILSASPFYNKPSQEGLFQHYRAIAEAAPLPVILYNVPGRTGRNMDAQTTLRLATEVDNVGGIKEASGDMLQCIEILKNRPESFMVVSGDDALALPQIACGMDGVISVAANVFPRSFSELVRLCLDNKFQEAKLLNDALIPAYTLMFAENNPAGAKAFLHEMKIMENVMRLPGVPLSGTLHQQVKRYLAENPAI